jgi:rod shape determining protein RodA
MSMSLLTRRSDSRKPDRALGQLRYSAGAPTRNIDWSLIGAVVALMVIGGFSVYSATWWKVPGDAYYYAIRQVVFLIVALVGTSLVMSLDYQWLKERAMFLYGATVLSLVLVLAAGAMQGGARLSFDFGPVSFQPAEFAKVTVMLALAAYLAEERSGRITYSRFAGGLVIVGVPVVLVVIQPDLGSASVLVAGAVGMLVVAGAKMRYIALITFLSVMTVAAAVTAGIVERYQLRRFEALFNQNSADSDLQNLVLQVRYAKRAVATGGLFGKGYLDAPLTNGKFIPVQQSDFIFSAVAEQWGMLGAGVVVGLFGLMLFRIWRIAHLSRDLVGTYICAAAFAMIAWHAFQNIGMTMGIMPVTGVPLPFVSYGGSSVLAFALLIGLVESVHMRRLR